MLRKQASGHAPRFGRAGDGGPHPHLYLFPTNAFFGSNFPVTAPSPNHSTARTRSARSSWRPKLHPQPVSATLTCGSRGGARGKAHRQSWGSSTGWESSWRRSGSSPAAWAAAPTARGATWCESSPAVKRGSLSSQRDSLVRDLTGADLRRARQRGRPLLLTVGRWSSLAQSSTEVAVVPRAGLPVLLRRRPQRSSRWHPRRLDSGLGTTATRRHDVW
jgi:hypothetical protein